MLDIPSAAAVMLAASLDSENTVLMAASLESALTFGRDYASLCLVVAFALSALRFLCIWACPCGLCAGPVLCISDLLDDALVLPLLHTLSISGSMARGVLKRMPYQPLQCPHLHGTDLFVLTWRQD